MKVVHRVCANRSPEYIIASRCHEHHPFIFSQRAPCGADGAARRRDQVVYF